MVKDHVRVGMCGWEGLKPANVARKERARMRLGEAVRLGMAGSSIPGNGALLKHHSSLLQHAEDFL